MKLEDVIEYASKKTSKARELKNEKKYFEARTVAFDTLTYLRDAIKLIDDKDANAKLRNTFDLLVKFVKDLDTYLDKNINDEKVESESNFKATKPSAKISLKDIIGHKKAKLEIEENLIEPLLDPETHKKYKVSVNKGMLMFGPPGTGKTTLAKAVANEIDAAFYNILCSEILDKYVGESEKKIKEVFDEASKQKRAIVFFDEFDSIASNLDSGSDVSRRVVSQLKSLLDGVESYENIYVLAATNYPRNIEFGIRRRLTPVYLGLPLQDEIAELLRLKTKGMPLDKDIDFDKISSLLEGYSGADIDKVISYAAKQAAKRERENKKTNKLYDGCITKNDIISSIERISKSVTSADLIDFEKFIEETK